MVKLMFHDVDGTLLDTTSAVKHCQIESLVKLSEESNRVTNSYESAKELLELVGLKGAVESFGSNLNYFFSDEGPYKTFDPYVAIKEGAVKLFDDVRSYLNSSENIDVAISNSELWATHNKLHAAGIQNYFSRIFAEVNKGKAKPSIYMAEKAIEGLDALGLYDSQKELIGIGDNAVDIQFYNNIKNIHPNTTSLWINRTAADYDTKRANVSLGSPDYDGMIRSYNELM